MQLGMLERNLRIAGNDKSHNKLSSYLIDIESKPVHQA